MLKEAYGDDAETLQALTLTIEKGKAGYDETAAKNPKFKKIYDSWKKFRDEQIQWFAVAENRYDNFMQAARTAAAKGGPK